MTNTLHGRAVEKGVLGVLLNLGVSFRFGSSLIVVTRVVFWRERRREAAEEDSRRRTSRGKYRLKRGRRKEC